MDTKVNYAIVGAFVLTLGAALVAGILWLAGGLQGQKEYNMYQAILSESVAGLNIGAPVKYLGVDIGKVNQIRLIHTDLQHIQLLIAIEKGIPIKQDTYAILKTQGLTGIAYLELNGGTPESPLLAIKESEPYSVILTKPSLSRRLEDVLTTTLAKLDRTSASIDDLLNIENRNAVKHILADTALLIHSVAEQRGTISQVLINANHTVKNTARFSKQIGPVLKNMNESALSLKHMGEEISYTSHSARQTFDTTNAGLGKLTGETLPQMESLLGEVGLLSSSLQRLSNQLERNPSSVIWGQRPVMPGPGEKE